MAAQQIFRVGVSCSNSNLAVLRQTFLVGATVKGSCSLHLNQPSRNKGTNSILGNFFGYKFFDRFDERSKIVVLDGNIGAGKTKLAKGLADQLGMKYMKEATIHYFDEKELGEGKKYDDKFMGSCSLERFYADPFAKDGHSFRFQLAMYAVRFVQYADALQHLLETGQGVVLERSVYSDSVFMEAMFKMGYFRRECYDYYNEVQKISLYRLKPPHCVIYMDTPVSDLIDNVKSRGLEYEQNIPVEYLEALEEEYKHKFLPAMQETSEVMVYDKNAPRDVERVVEDFDMLKFEHLPWNEMTDDNFDKLYRFVRDKRRVAQCMWMPKYLPEITFGAEQFNELTVEFEEKHSVGKGYAPDLNPDQPFSKLFFK
ncbi:NADH dehydrogenase [ubiquinone] 1 alpha subcomplex subunit 10, mitochondrial-like isoform X1 [Lytechinus pictus]|uniref:NADH dehydrogenase [ubiquinone] 1 alpha subcomplex subunit 10, mitochondrial-like isoform X1 n=1 Tax=Lytechinus pictus TaxID=7653 RepID=UPI0030B9D272